MKRPAFQFYPADWRKDVELHSCSLAARGLWIELSCVMHDCRPYGHLALAGEPMSDVKAAGLVGAELKVYRTYLAELEAAGVSSRTDGGVLFSRRMVKDEHIRAVRAAAGSKGGNPHLLGNLDKQIGEERSKQNPTPSSASSSSASAIDQKQTDSPSKGESEGKPDFGLTQQTGKPAPINGVHKPAANARAMRIGADWKLPPEWLQWAIDAHHFPRAKVVDVSLVFRDHWLAKAGPDGAKLDWFATWRNWIRREASRGS